MDPDSKATPSQCQLILQTVSHKKTKFNFAIQILFTDALFNIGITKKYLSLYLKIALIVVVIIRGAMYQAAGGQ